MVVLLTQLRFIHNRVMHRGIHPSIHWWVLVQSGHHHVGQESGGPEIPSPVQK